MTAKITLDPAFKVGPVRRNTFGTFVEHLGRCVYTGIFEPGHPSADEDGFRTDVLDLVRELGISTVRYPGGNFVSAYRWRDGIGPVADRPRRLDLAWHSTEPNTFGLDEFMRWSKKAQIEPMMAVNLGTAGVQEALDLIEYCNVPGGTALSDERRTNGADEPYRIKMWCLGNEMDGPWQTGHKTAAEYGRLAAETGRAMRQVDPELTLVACGSSGRGMPTFGTWEYTVLSECYDQVDLISAHAYYWEKNGDLASFLACATDMDKFIESVAATADAVKAAGKHEKTINISFDEWNVWYLGLSETENPKGDDWPVAPPLLEDNYNVADAVVVGNLLISLLRHTDRVHAASLAQLVNVIAPIFTKPGGGVFKQTTFHPFALTSRYAKGDVLQVAIDAPIVSTKEFGDVSVIDAVATFDSESGDVTIFVVNRNVTDAMPLEVDLNGFTQQGHLKVVEALTMSNSNPYLKASFEDDHSMAPQPNCTAAIADNHLTVELPPVSWSMIRLAPEQAA